jgi:P27 family predicted phage terminase small subunit
MGRKKADPREQRQRGHPGKRKSKVERELAAMEKRAAEDAKLLATSGNADDVQALPMFINDKRLAPAIAIWKEYAPRLDKLHLLATLDRHTFAMFCVYCAEFALANRDIMVKGYSLEVPTIAKYANGKPGMMYRDNPAVDRRDFAAKMIMDLSVRFGLTPLDRQQLIKINAMRADEQTLFGRMREAPRPADAPKSDAADEPAVPAGGAGEARGFDSPPPTRTH